MDRRSYQSRRDTPQAPLKGGIPPMSPQASLKGGFPPPGLIPPLRGDKGGCSGFSDLDASGRKGGHPPSPPQGGISPHVPPSPPQGGNWFGGRKAQSHSPIEGDTPQAPLKGGLPPMSPQAPLKGGFPPCPPKPSSRGHGLIPPLRGDEGGCSGFSDLDASGRRGDTPKPPSRGDFPPCPPKPPSRGELSWGNLLTGRILRFHSPLEGGLRGVSGLGCITLLACLFLAACGYHFSGGGQLPGDISTISVEVFENRTIETGLERVSPTTWSMNSRALKASRWWPRKRPAPC